MLGLALLSIVCGIPAALAQGDEGGDPRGHLQLMTCLDKIVQWPNDIHWQQIEYNPSWAKESQYLVLYHLKDGGLSGPQTGNCLSAPEKGKVGDGVSRGGCGGKQQAAQAWVFEGGNIKHNASGLCLATKISGPQAMTNVVLDSCSSSLALSADPPKPGENQVMDKKSSLCLDCGNEPQFTSPCDPKQGKFRTAPFCNLDLDVKKRVADLLKKTALADKLTQFAMWASSMPSVHVNSYQFWNEGLHGVAGGPGVRFEEPTRNATVFPEPIGVATSWNRSLWRAVGAVVATEGRAMHNAGTSGLTYWAPNISEGTSILFDRSTLN
jgi:hypothetical protein